MSKNQSLSLRGFFCFTEEDRQLFSHIMLVGLTLVYASGLAYGAFAKYENDILACQARGASPKACTVIVSAEFQNRAMQDMLPRPGRYMTDSLKMRERWPLPRPAKGSIADYGFNRV